MAAAFALVGLLVVAYVVGWLIESVVTGALLRSVRDRALQRRQAEQEAQVLRNAVSVKRLLDAQALAAHQQLLRVAREHSRHQE